MQRDEIKALALEKGFTLREQPDGSVDLNPYVYEFAEALQQRRTQTLERNLRDAEAAGRRLAKQAHQAEQEVERLRQVCAEAYQLAGALDAPVEALDNLSAAMMGQPLPHASFLPVTVAASRRAELCLKALEHVSDEVLESGEMYHAGLRIKDLTKERDALAARLEVIPGGGPDGIDCRDATIALQDARIDDLLATCHRLALELECLLLDTKDSAPVSRWWDSAMAALDGWHKAKDAASVRPVPADPVNARLVEALEDFVAEFGVCGLTEKARAALAAVEAQQADEACPTCGGSGAIGGFRHGEGYDQEPCPDCTKQAEPVRLTEEDRISLVERWVKSPQRILEEFAAQVEAMTLRKQGYKVEG